MHLEEVVLEGGARDNLNSMPQQQRKGGRGEERAYWLRSRSSAL